MSEHVKRMTTIYGSWTTLVNPHSPGPDADVLDYISGGDSDWRQLMDASGALAAMQDDYRAEINKALPPSVSLSGVEFIGPNKLENGEWDGYPVDENGDLDIRAICESVDLESILERHDIITLEEIGRFELNSRAQNPSSAASQAMRRLGLKPLARVQINGEGQAVAVYNRATVRKALSKRTGRGRTHTA